MLRRIFHILGRSAVIVSTVLFVGIFLAWLTGPQWWSFGTVNSTELDIHVATAGANGGENNYVALIVTRNRSANNHPHGERGAWYGFHEGGSGWGNPIMQKWDWLSDHDWSRLWFGHAANLNSDERAYYFTADIWILELLAAILPMFGLNRWLLNRRIKKHAAAQTPPADPKTNPAGN